MTQATCTSNRPVVSIIVTRCKAKLQWQCYTLSCWGQLGINGGKIGKTNFLSQNVKVYIIPLKKKKKKACPFYHSSPLQLHPTHSSCREVWETCPTHIWKSCTTSCSQGDRSTKYIAPWEKGTNKQTRLRDWQKTQQTTTMETECLLPKTMCSHGNRAQLTPHQEVRAPQIQNICFPSLATLPRQQVP